MIQWDFSQVGGTQIVQGDGDIAWNFGVANPQVTMKSNAPTLYSAFPNLQGRWDGKTPVNHHEHVRTVLGTDIKPHKQPKGTCGSRAGSRGLEILQCNLIAAGQRAKFKYVSHAWIYYLARREFNMLGGGDGVASGSVPPILAKYGALTREENGDLDFDSNRSDDMAASWGDGRISKADVQKYEGLAKDNIVTALVKVESAAELADGLAAGGVGICSDSQGYSMERDGDGFCRRSGTWYHYHVRSGITVTSRGRKGFDYNQSWGAGTPDGPRLEGRPDNCFAVDWDVEENNIRNGDFHVIFGFDLWDLQSGKIPWEFF